MRRNSRHIRYAAPSDISKYKIVHDNVKIGQTSRYIWNTTHPQLKQIINGKKYMFALDPATNNLVRREVIIVDKKY